MKKHKRSATNKRIVPVLGLPRVLAISATWTLTGFAFFNFPKFSFPCVPIVYTRKPVHLKSSPSSFIIITIIIKHHQEHHHLVSFCRHLMKGGSAAKLGERENATSRL